MKITHCPICGIAFEEPVEEETLRFSYWICHCCGCEYGNDDIPDYRDKWIQRGAPWFAERERPIDWTLQEQLRHADLSWNKQTV